MSVTEVSSQESYLQGVDLLLRGRASEAVRLLRPIANGRLPAARLALAKAHLELRQGDLAAAELDWLLAQEGQDASLRAYLHLLAASAAALAGGEDARERHLTASVECDPRMERAARALGRRVRKGRPPVVSF